MSEFYPDMSDSYNSSSGDDKSIGDCTMYETTAELIINSHYIDKLPNLFLTILKNSCEHDYADDNNTTYRDEYNAKTIFGFKKQHLSHKDKTFNDDVSAKFQLLYLIINKYNQNATLNDTDTANDPEQIENDLMKIPSEDDVDKFIKFLNNNNIGEHTGEVIDTSTQCPVSPITPTKTGESQHMQFDGPPMLQQELKKCDRKRARSPSPTTGGKRKTRKVLKRIPKVLKWRDMDPPKKTLKSFKKKHGNKCFLRPKELKYPICDKYKGKVNCKGLLAAHNRAMLSVRRGLKPKKYSYKKLAKTARKVAKKHKCNWVLKKSKKSKK